MITSGICRSLATHNRRRCQWKASPGDLSHGDGLFAALTGRVDVDRASADLAQALTAPVASQLVGIDGASADHSLVAGSPLGSGARHYGRQGRRRWVVPTCRIPCQAGEAHRRVLFHPGLGTQPPWRGCWWAWRMPRGSIGDGDGAGVGQHGGVSAAEGGVVPAATGWAGRLVLLATGGGARLGDLQVVTQLGVHVLQGGSSYVVCEDHGTIADDALPSARSRHLAARAGGTVDGDALRPTQLYSVDVQVGALPPGSDFPGHR